MIQIILATCWSLAMSAPLGATKSPARRRRTPLMARVIEAGVKGRERVTQNCPCNLRVSAKKRDAYLQECRPVGFRGRTLPLRQPRLPEHLAILSELSEGRITAQSFAEARSEYMGPKSHLTELQRSESMAVHIASRVLEQLRGVSGGVAQTALSSSDFDPFPTSEPTPL
jgi:hypothetical protein